MAGAEVQPSQAKDKHMKLFIRPVFTVRADGSEQLLSLAVCTTAGPILVDEQILEHFDKHTSGRDIRENYPDDVVDWAETIEVKS
jgi:hypothetical protein